MERLTVAKLADSANVGPDANRFHERQEHTSSAARPGRERMMTMAKRKVEVFTAGCPVCDPAVKTVQAAACPDCEVVVYDLRSEGADRARQYDLKSVPAVVVDGKLCACCENSGVNEAELRAAGVGQPLS